MKTAIHALALWLATAQALTIPHPYPRATQGPARRQVPIDETEAELVSSAYLTSYATSDIVPRTETVPLKTSVQRTGTVVILPTLSVEPHTDGVIITDIASSSPPLLTRIIASPTSLLEPIEPTSTTSSSSKSKGKGGKRQATYDDGDDITTDLMVVEERQTANIFDVPISTNGPPSMIPRRKDHPVKGIELRKSGPVQTNKFYSNFFLGDQTNPTYTMPYAINWAKGKGATGSWGLSISQIQPKQKVYGPVKYNDAASFYINPIGIQQMVLSATELGPKTILSIDRMGPFSARINLKKNAASFPTIQFPLVQGMPYITGTFVGGTPLIQTGVYIRQMTKVAKNPKANVAKYNFLLEDGTTWHVYAHCTGGAMLNLKTINNGLVQSTKPFTGSIQIVKDTFSRNSEQMLDDGAGVYPTGVELTGSTSGKVGTYSFKFQRAGHPSGSLYMWALPHHVASFDAATRSRTSAFQMYTHTKGKCTLVRDTVWTMVEPEMPTSMGHGPWDASTRSTRKSLSASAKAAVRAVALMEASQDMDSQTNLNSMYFSGKALLKFAQICYTIQDLVGDKPLAAACTAKLKDAFNVFAQNKQQFPLNYESQWGGVVSTASYVTGDPLVDFGNTYYNDHHFHYGYHVLAAAFLSYLDNEWRDNNKDWVDTLVRDYANPSAQDSWFPQHRSFDWYHGHSWAAGLFASLDGKNQESSSEDIMAMYAIRLWGSVTKDTAMIARANLQLAVMTRALDSYYLMKSDNTNHPSQFVGNKAAGIVFENKVDHTTFFSSDIECIQGIHMLPIHAPTTYSRSKAFVQEEWDAYFSNGRVDKLDNAWKSIIYANYATVQPKAAWDYFNKQGFDASLIDGGASRAWYMAYAAALGKL
ncbi:uncharacterized protein J7T54_003511 [Emericellopsis cladophorae]|uniref:glucan endo-1,3-beta-D-glucosidase n=1 Tax=Emericellopsis cladophorae TaxID=2686198 RepID=A0A9Q0BEP6_9HYPO|nr:uncharacterized protein J7T54_003511 [Emericellopsis cladophorae]KAI6782091.1 hypothetical protein J7T54_003511 [Emericellopsis cladophorae]